MANITVKNIPDSTYESLKLIATSNYRSVNSEIIHLIEKAITSKPLNPERHIAFAKQARNKTKQFLLTEDILNLAKSEGRP